MTNSTTFLIERIQYIQKLFDENAKLFDRECIPEVTTKGSKRVISQLPLKIHPHHGETVLHLTEKFDVNGNIIEHHYGWELSQRKKKMGKQPRHIMAFGNEDHPDPPMWVSTNPYHHHHVPLEPKKRKSTSVEDLETVIGILTDYIHGDLQYDSNHTF